MRVADGCALPTLADRGIDVHLADRARKAAAMRSPAGLLLDLDGHNFAVEPSPVLGLIEQGVRLGEGICAGLGSAAHHRPPLIAHQGSAPGRSYSSQVTPPI
jgi:hypothetical protein